MAEVFVHVSDALKESSFDVVAAHFLVLRRVREQAAGRRVPVAKVWWNLMAAREKHGGRLPRQGPWTFHVTLDDDDYPDIGLKLGPRRPEAEVPTDSRPPRHPERRRRRRGYN